MLNSIRIVLHINIVRIVDVYMGFRNVYLIIWKQIYIVFITETLALNEFAYFLYFAESNICGSTVRLSLERTQVSSFISCMYCISCFTSASPSMEYTNWICLSRNSSVSHVTSTHSSFPIINVLSPHLFLDTAEGVEMIEHSPCDLI